MIIEPYCDDLLDMRFGHWIKNQRFKRKLTRKEVHYFTNIPENRLRNIEIGIGKGITILECQILAECYKMNLQELLNKAKGN